ncbi:MAG: STM3941 family protein [Bacteroidota bacterium]
MQNTIRYSTRTSKYLYIILFMLILGGSLAWINYYLLNSLGYDGQSVFTVLIWFGIGAAGLGVLLSIYRMFTSRNVYLEINQQGIKNKLQLNHTIDISWSAISKFELKSDLGIQKVIIVHLHNQIAFLDHYKRTTGKSIPMSNVYRANYSSPVVISTLMLHEKPTVLLDKLNEYLHLYSRR